MILRIAAALLIASSIALGARNPTTRKATSKPATAPAVKAYPTPGALLEQMNAIRDKKKQLAGVAYIELDKPVVEKPADFALFSDPGITLQSLMERLHMARDDKDMRAVLITMAQTDFNLSQAQEIRTALNEIRKAGKRVFVYSDGYDTAGYIMASGASDICMLPGGEIMIPGVGMEAMFAKGLLDKIGVQADYVQIGEYKGADEQFTRKEASKELKGELNRLVDAIYKQIVDGIAFNRNMAPSKVEELIDEALITAKVAKDRGLIDHIVDIDGMRDLMAKELGRGIDLVHDYGEPKHEAMDLSNPFALFQLLAKKPPAPKGPSVALIYAEGVIVDGEGGGGMFGGNQVGSEDLRKAFRMAARDNTIKAIVLRIDSPGGSAVASEAIWQAARRAAKEKPVIISIGSMAASGGYYIACAGDRIFADPSGIVGSIGVVGGKFVFKELFEKTLGLTTEKFTRGKNADLFSSNQPFTDSQRRMVTNWMRQTYEQFTERVMETRHGRIKDIDQVARGRIFMAKQGLELGMVDQLGGLNDAIAYAAKEAKLDDGDYDVRTVPGQKTLFDLLRGDDDSGAQARLPIRPQMSAASLPLLRALDKSTASMLTRQLQMIEVVRNRPIMLVSPYVVTVR